MRFSHRNTKRLSAVLPGPSPAGRFRPRVWSPASVCGRAASPRLCGREPADAPAQWPREARGLSRTLQCDDFQCGVGRRENWNGRTEHTMDAPRPQLRSGGNRNLSHLGMTVTAGRDRHTSRSQATAWASAHRLFRDRTPDKQVGPLGQRPRSTAGSWVRLPGAKLSCVLNGSPSCREREGWQRPKALRQKLTGVPPHRNRGVRCEATENQKLRLTAGKDRHLWRRRGGVCAGESGASKPLASVQFRPAPLPIGAETGALGLNEPGKREMDKQPNRPVHAGACRAGNPAGFRTSYPAGRNNRENRK